MSTIHARVRLALVAWAAFGLLSGAAQAAILEVCASGCPYATIQSAVDAALNGDTVLIHPGTYVENVLFTAEADITVTSSAGPEVTIVDGNGTGAVFECKSWSAPRIEQLTIRNGYPGVSVMAATVVGCIITDNVGSGAVGWGLDVLGCRVMNNAGGVATGWGLVADCTISGNTGFGVEGFDLGPDVFGCTITHNGGGGILCLYGCDVSQCTITDNTAVRGGGIDFIGGDITDCVISRNAGGGVHARGSVSIANSDISLNAGDGVGASPMDFADVTIAGSTICNNTGKGVGGFEAISINDSIVCANTLGLGADDVHALNTIVSGNGGPAVGGGVQVWGTSDLTNCLVSGNYTPGNGGGILLESSASVDLINCTLRGNYAEGFGGGVYGKGTIVNSILWGNDSANATGAADQIYESYGTFAVTYSDVQGGWPGEGNIEAGPAFVQPIPVDQAPTTAGNYHLRPGSPCVDAGTADGAPPDDIDGDLRPIGFGFDMGSDECDPTHIFIDGFESGSTSAWSATLP